VQINYAQHKNTLKDYWQQGMNGTATNLQKQLPEQAMQSTCLDKKQIHIRLTVNLVVR
jgi:hypothetical protein